MGSDNITAGSKGWWDLMHSAVDGDLDANKQLLFWSINDQLDDD